MNRWLMYVAITGFYFAFTANVYAQRYVEGEVIVKLKDRKGTEGLKGFSSKASINGKFTIEKSHSALRLHHMKINAAQTVEQSVDELRNDPEVEYAEPNWIFEKQDIGSPNPNDIFAAGVQAMSACSGSVTAAAIQYLQSWNLLGPNTTIPVVAIIDSGIDRNHSVFTQSGALWVNSGEIAGNGADDDHNGYVDDVYGWNFINNTNNNMDDEGHGTHVAGTVLGMSQDIFTSPYPAAKVKIMGLKFLDSTGYGTTSAAISAIYYASNNGAKVLNNSWGGSGYSQALKDAIAYSYTKKALFAAAAGNSYSNNNTNPMYPASYDVPNIISVAATTNADDKAWFSNFGTSSVHFGSPGTSICSTYPNNTMARMDGTSMATPIVAGIAAMMLHEKPELTGYQVKSLLFDASEYKSALANYTIQKSRVNAYGAVYAAKNGTPPANDPNYISSNPYRDVASTTAGCGTVKKLGRPNPGNWTPMNGLILFLLAMPLLISILMKQRLPREGRRYDRFKIHSAVTLVANGKEFVGEVSSISLGGVKVDTEALLRQGGIVTMSISSPDGKEAIQVQGHVVWNEANKHYGVQFDNAQQSVLSSITNWSKSLVKI
jgi:hypothetical protein